jgi:predicted tellurium resistance membrane protein TerC
MSGLFTSENLISLLTLSAMEIVALSFLLLIGSLLVADGLGKHIEKGYIYFAMAFSLVIELLNMRFRKKQAPVHLHQQFEQKGSS